MSCLSTCPFLYDSHSSNARHQRTLTTGPQEVPVALSLVTSRNQEGEEERTAVDWRGGQIEIPLMALQLGEGEALRVEDPWGNSATLSIPGR